MDKGPNVKILTTARGWLGISFYTKQMVIPFWSNSNLSFCLCVFCLRQEVKMNLYFPLSSCSIDWHWGDHPICPNIITWDTTKAMAVSTLRGEVVCFFLNEQMQHHLENPFVILLVVSVAMQTSVMWDKKDDFFWNTKNTDRKKIIFRS